VLELAGTPEAKKLLTDLSRGQPGAIRTELANLILQRAMPAAP